MSKRAFGDWVKLAKEKHDGRFSYDESGFAEGRKLRVFCKDHGAFLIEARSHVTYGQGCRKCRDFANGERHRAKMLTEAEFVIRAYKVHGNRYDLSDLGYRGMHKPITPVCKEHGRFETSASNFLKGAGCYQCGLVARGQTRTGKQLERLRALAAKSEWLKYDFSDFAGNKSYIRVTCPKHGEFRQLADAILYGVGCKHCSEEKRFERQRYSTDTFIDIVEGKFPGRFEFSKTIYTESKSPIVLTCKKHGDFESTPNYIISSIAGCCPRCANFQSSYERLLVDWLRELGEIVEERNRTVLKPKEIDVWLPERNLGIEIHGNYWHQENRVGQAIHRSKWEKANEVGIRLLQVFEDEWVKNQSLVRERILALLGKGERRFARKCKVETVDWVTAARLLDTWHTQGRGSRGSFSVALFEGDDPVAVLTAGPARKGDMVGVYGSSYEIYRYASKGTVIGGFSRLLRVFEEGCKPNRVVSYCDLRYGDGRMYSATGFELDGITEPDYFWFIPSENRRVSRYSTQKHKLKTDPRFVGVYDEKLTERQMCEALGWQKIFGVGHQRWVLTRNTDTEI